MNETRKENLNAENKLKSKETIKEQLPQNNNQNEYSGMSLTKFHGFPILKSLNSGGEADVYLIQCNNEKRVLKLYRNGMDIKESLLSQVKTIADDNYEHLVQIYEYGLDVELQRWFEIMEYCEFGDLRELVPPGYGNNKLLKDVILEIASALNSLHEGGIIHRDLKPDNILVRTKRPLDLVFSDFGMSSESQNTQKMTTTFGGSPEYMAPESFSHFDGNTVVSKSIDWWALGIILFELISGNTPYAELNPAVIGTKIITEDIVLDDEIFNEWQITILSGLLHRDPKQRWVYKDIIDFVESGFTSINKSINLQQQTSIKTNLKLVKCVSCGAEIDSTACECPKCGNIMINVNEASNSIKIFMNKYENSSDKDKANVVKTFILPNLREDLLEFLSIGIGNTKNLTQAERNKYIEDTWKGTYKDSLHYLEDEIKSWQLKVEEAIEKCNLLFVNESDKALIVNYKNQLYKNMYGERDRDRKIIRNTLIGFLIFIVLCFIPSILEESSSKNMSDNLRVNLSNRVIEVQDLISESRYDEALVKVNGLVWDYNPKSFEEEAEVWENRRKDLISIINDLKNEE